MSTHSDSTYQHHHYAEISFTAVDAVDRSWSSIREIPNYEVVVGERLFRKLFEVTPRASNLFAFGLVDGDNLAENLLFKRHAQDIIHLLDEVVNMLGPDMLPISDTLRELGARHVRYGVLPYYFEVMLGQALMHALEETLDETKWTPIVQHGWEGVCHFVSSSMIEGATEERERLRQQEKAKGNGCGVGTPRKAADVKVICASKPDPSSVSTTFKETINRRRSSTTSPRDHHDKVLSKSIPAKTAAVLSDQQHHHRRGILAWIDTALKTSSSPKVAAARQH
jgi:hemoglobin-like flavoprotein